MKIALLDRPACEACADQLAAGPALGFWPRLDIDGAHRYWRDVGRSVDAGTRLLVTALDGDRLVGAAQLALCRVPDPGCAEVRSMFVASAMRRRGIGGVLVRALEAEAMAHGRDRVFLDAVAGSGIEALYRDLGYAPDHGAPPLGGCTRYRKLLLVPEAA